MSPGNTHTGKVLESIVIPAVEKDYDYQRQARIGLKPDGTSYIADLLLTPKGVNEGEQILVSLKWQQVLGTAEQKIPFEVITLIKLLRDKKCHRAYLVLGGNGWRPKLKRFYLSEELHSYIPDAKLATIVDLNDFIALINQKKL